MQSSVPWYAESSEAMRARVAGIIPEPFAFAPPSFMYGGVPSSASSLVTRKRKKKSDRHQLLPHVDNGRVAKQALALKSLASRVPKPITDYEVNAVLFQQGMNMGSADAVAEKLRQRCVPDVVISSASVDFLGKVIESTLRITVGWQAYVEYTGYFFQYVPDGIFTLKSSETMVEDGENGNEITVVRSIYTFTGSLVVSSAVVESEPDIPTEASTTENDSTPLSNELSIGEVVQEESSFTSNSNESSEVKRVRKDLDSVFLVDELSDDTGTVEISEALFTEDGLPTLPLHAEQALLQSPEFLISSEDDLAPIPDDVSMPTESPDSTQVPAPLSSESISPGRLSKTLSESSVSDATQPPSDSSADKAPSASAPHSKVVLKPKAAQVPKVQDEHAHNVFVDKEFDVAERFLITETSKSGTVSSAGKRNHDKKESTVDSGSSSTDLDTTSSMSTDDSSIDSISTSTSPTPAPTVVTSLDVVGAFNVYLNRHMQVEKLEFVYRNRLS